MALLLNNSIFLHVFKTGGSWAEIALKKSDKTNSFISIEKHVGLKKVQNNNLIKKNNIFAFVRNPLTWHQSYFSYRNWKEDWYGEFDEYVNSGNFEDYINKTIEFGEKRNKSFLLSHYESFIGEEHEKIDYIGKYENLKEDLINILDLFNEDVDKDILLSIPNINVTPPIFKERAVYTPELKNKLINHEFKIFERFGYNK